MRARPPNRVPDQVMPNDRSGVAVAGCVDRAFSEMPTSRNCHDGSGAKQRRSTARTRRAPRPPVDRFSRSVALTAARSVVPMPGVRRPDFLPDQPLGSPQLASWERPTSISSGPRLTPRPAPTDAAEQENMYRWGRLNAGLGLGWNMTLKARFSIGEHTGV
jgi:hypothetical protein